MSIHVTTRLDLVDYHIHTARCGHARGEMAAYVERAIRAGLPEMGFSDHIFLYWLPADRRDPELAMSEDQFDAYVEDVLRLRRAYPEIAIRLAVEADFIVDQEATLKGILDRYPWDYVLGSVHFIGDWGMDDGRYLEPLRRVGHRRAVRALLRRWCCGRRRAATSTRWPTWTWSRSSGTGRARIWRTCTGGWRGGWRRPAWRSR